MALSNTERLVNSGMVPGVAKEVTAQIADASGGSVAWADVTGKPSTFPATTPVATATSLATGRTITVNFAAAAAAPSFNGTANVTASIARAAAQANSTATDVAGLVADFNALLAKLRTVGILAP